jgi:hypothetical protein
MKPFGRFFRISFLNFFSASILSSGNSDRYFSGVVALDCIFKIVQVKRKTSTKKKNSITKRNSKMQH